jgi:hypothetical protein
MTQIKTAIQQMVKSMVKPDLMIGKVTAFNGSDWTISLELNIGAKVEDVTIKSVLNGEDSGIFIEPIEGSYVLVGMTDGKLENLTALVFSEIKNIRFAPTEKLILRNDDYGGILKAEAVLNNLNSLKNAIETIKSAVATGLTSVGASTAANGALGAEAYNTATAGVSINFEAMENENITHG